LPVEQILAEIHASKRADYVGSASLLSAVDFVRDQGGDFIAEFATSISIGIALPSAIVDLLPRRGERSVQVSYRSHAYDIINQRLDILSSDIASALQMAGYKAFPIPASERVDDKKICASFSHKVAANLAGFGWIGKSCLLITKRHGPRVRWATVLTDAPSETIMEQLPDGCGTCTKCVDICPVNAFTDRHFVAAEPRERRYAAEKCDKYFQEMESQGDLKVCGMCLYVCPFGMSSISRNHGIQVK
jgi:epoxyqueuosine reductase QueG